MNKREKIIVFFIVILVLIYAGTLSARKRKVKPAASPAAPGTVTKPGSQKPLQAQDKIEPGVLVELIKLKSLGMELTLARDPFVRPAEVEAEEAAPAVGIEDLSLSGIIMESPPMAIINNQILKEGDDISGYRIWEIRPNEVILDKDEETFFLNLSVVPDPAQTLKEADQE